MDKRVRWMWITLSLVWILSCVLALYRAAPPAAPQSRPIPAAAAGVYTAAEDRHANSIVVVVMPSPPMVSEPLTRIDRLGTIHDTWGRDLLELGNHENSVVFVVDESDSSTAKEASEAWGVLETSPLSPDERHLQQTRVEYQEDSIPRAKQQSYDHRKNQEAEQNVRVIVVPDEITRGGVDGDARLRYVLGAVWEARDPAFLFFCNEHTFVVAENLLCYVDGLDPSEPVYLGNRFRKEEKEERAVDATSRAKPLLNSGAAGFVLSRASLALLNRAWRGGGEGGGDGGSAGYLPRDGGIREQAVDGREGGGLPSERGPTAGGMSAAFVPPPECVAKSDFERGNPGLTLARCLDYVGVQAQDTTDEKGGQRFNAYGPVRLAQGKIDQWYKDVHATDPGMWRAGPGCCSTDTVSFHYVGPAEARAMHTILHHKEKYLTKGYDEALGLWPASPRDLGPYAARPRPGDATFDLLLNKIRLCSLV